MLDWMGLAFNRSSNFFRAYSCRYIGKIQPSANNYIVGHNNAQNVVPAKIE
jgi:hypothetical protein